ncbi:ATP-grasp domain-containing protein [Mumia zhuanghuii]|uniref:Acetyl/propionyl/methylcrotonyl-CoA carboxylase subunit alpha n=2 Tax=Mumia TaxID=1546255 RepID=A0ABW1QKU1_9ACTN|nr:MULTISPECIES: biotin carboxylase N-terminal domain-containing protein [Mumia]KAA1424914.1 ATP-grasp domain-containing protein [Mumia zhuanghuii]
MTNPSAGRASAASRDSRFTSVLVANRGEIAVRIVRAVQAAGLRAIAVHSDLDASAPHVRLADHSERVESYLSVDAILDAARRSGAQAVHPGYGFLSERADAARAVVDAGLVWIGPSADVIDLMGRKDRAREVAERAGVPVTRRYDVPTGGYGDVAYPVLVKAAAGGGGKGMRVVRDPADLDAAVAAARREAASAFGDDTLLVEEYVERGRHVEVQVIGDEHGTVLHLFERDCSAQRRHQKVLEEAPAPTISDATRAGLTEAAVALCREVGYVNAGTVEFLVHGPDDTEIAFLEMNTRLQVEHPVTEAITGLDLVALQLRVAQGLPLGIAQDDIGASGHAIEARVYAEDPYAGFLPQAGRATTVVWPEHVRVDAALESGAEITTAYDPMLGKLIAHGPDREAARAALVDALDRTAVLGVTTNAGFLRRLVASDAFRDATIHTAWLDSAAAEELTTRPAVPAPAARSAARAWARTNVSPADDPFGAADGWRSGAAPASVLVSLVDTDDASVELALGPGSYEVPGPEDGPSVVAHGGVAVAYEGQSWTFRHPDPARDRANEGVGDADVVSPMPGTVLSVAVAEGETVDEGQVLGVVEAMKMEIALKAPYAGTVARVGVVAGEQVALGALLFRVEDLGAEVDS